MKIVVLKSQNVELRNQFDGEYLNPLQFVMPSNCAYFLIYIL